MLRDRRPAVDGGLLGLLCALGVLGRVPAADRFDLGRVVGSRRRWAVRPDRHPGHGECATGDAEQHADEEPAQVEGDQPGHRDGGADDAVEEPLGRAEPGQHPAQQDRQRDQPGEEPLRPEAHLDRHQVHVRGDVELQAGQEQEEPAPERSGATPPAEPDPEPGEPRYRVRGVSLRGPVAVQKHSSPFRLTCRSSPLRLNWPALVDHATWRRPVIVTASACWPKPPAWPTAPCGPLVSVEAS